MAEVIKTTIPETTTEAMSTTSSEAVTTVSSKDESQSVNQETIHRVNEQQQEQHYIPQATHLNIGHLQQRAPVIPQLPPFNGQHEVPHMTQQHGLQPPLNLGPHFNHLSQQTLLPPQFPGGVAPVPHFLHRPVNFHNMIEREMHRLRHEIHQDIHKEFSPHPLDKQPEPDSKPVVEVDLVKMLKNYKIIKMVMEEKKPTRRLIRSPLLMAFVAPAMIGNALFGGGGGLFGAGGLGGFGGFGGVGGGGGAGGGAGGGGGRGQPCPPCQPDDDRPPEQYPEHPEQDPDQHPDQHPEQDDKDWRHEDEQGQEQEPDQEQYPTSQFSSLTQKDKYHESESISQTSMVDNKKFLTRLTQQGTASENIDSTMILLQEEGVSSGRSEGRIRVFLMKIPRNEMEGRHAKEERKDSGIALKDSKSDATSSFEGIKSQVEDASLIPDKHVQGDLTSTSHDFPEIQWTDKGRGNESETSHEQEDDTGSKVPLFFLISSKKVNDSLKGGFVQTTDTRKTFPEDHLSKDVREQDFLLRVIQGYSDTRDPLKRSTVLASFEGETNKSPRNRKKYIRVNDETRKETHERTKTGVDIKNEGQNQVPNNFLFGFPGRVVSEGLKR